MTSRCGYYDLLVNELRFLGCMTAGGEHEMIGVSNGELPPVLTSVAESVQNILSESTKRRSIGIIQRCLTPPPPQYICSNLTRRLLLALPALAFLILAVLTVAIPPSAPVAEAHPPNHDDLACDGSADAPEVCDTFPRPPVFLATMHVDKFTWTPDGSEWYGCSTLGNFANCNQAWHDRHALRKHDVFRIPHAPVSSYTIWMLMTAGTSVQFITFGHLPDTFKLYTLYLGDVALPVNSASRFERRTIGGGLYKITHIVWSLPESLGWADGDEVDVFMVPPLWSGELTVGETDFGLGCGTPRTPTNTGADCSSGLSGSAIANFNYSATVSRAVPEPARIDFKGNASNLEYVNLRGPDGVFGGNSLRFAVDSWFWKHHFLTLMVDGKPFRFLDAVDYGCHHCNIISGVDRTGDLWDSGYDAASGRGFHVFTWGDSGLNWAEGDKVTLGLVYTPLVWMETATNAPVNGPSYFHVRETPPPGTEGDVLGYYGLGVEISEPAGPGGVRVDLTVDRASTARHGVDYEFLNSYDSYFAEDQQGQVTTSPHVFFAEGEGGKGHKNVYLRVIDDDHEDSGETIIINPVAEGFESHGMVVTILNHDDGPPPEGAAEKQQISLAPEKTKAEERKQPIPGKSSNANLRALSLTAGGGSLHPAFTPDNNEYTVHLTEQQSRYSSLYVTARPEHGGAKVTVDGQPTQGGHAYVNSQAGFRTPVTFEVVVTAADGATAKTYTLTTTTDPVPKHYSLSPAATAAEGESAALTITLDEAAPAGGVEFTVSAGYGGSATATSNDVGSITSPATVAEGKSTLEIAIPTVDDDVDEDDETFTVTISAATAGWGKEDTGKDTATITITDDDTAGVTLTPTTLNVVESGSGTYTVVLDSKPTHDVTITPTGDDGAGVASLSPASLDFALDDRNSDQPSNDATGGDDGAASFSPASLTFTPSDWNVPQSFTVSVAAENVGISHQVGSRDANYAGIAVASVDVSVDDTTPDPEKQVLEAPVELPGPVVDLQLSSKTDSVTVSWQAPESGGAVDRYIVHLKPAGGGNSKNRTVDAGKRTTTFRNLKGGASYMVWVRGQNAGGKGERTHARITLPELPGPVGSLLLATASDSVTVSWQAPENGGAVDNYIVHLKPADGSEGKSRTVNAGKTTTTFRKLEAGSTYEVRVRAANEWGKGERASASITLPEPDPVEQEPPPEQDAQPKQQETVRTFSVSATATAVEGTDATLTLTLSEAAPADGVEFTATAGYGGSSTATADDVGSITSPVTVAEGNSTLQISVPTASDAVDEDDETFTVTIAAGTSGWEKEGDGKDTASVTITDDDTAGVTVTPTTLSISEDGSGTYTVVLASKPTTDVTVTLTGSDDGAASFSPASHTFTPSDWNTPQTFTVSGVSDEDRDDESVSISHDVISSDGNYNGISADSVSVAVSDTTPEPEPPVPGQIEPFNVRVVPGDGTLTVTWTLSPREVGDSIKHALRWSQEAGVWANPRGSRSPNDGIVVESGVFTYTITGLQNGVATGVFVRSFVGNDSGERSPHSSKWVRVKGDHTTPRAE